MGVSEALEVKDNRLNTILDCMLEGIILVDLEGKIIGLNSRIASHLGIEDRVSLYGKSLALILAPADTDKVQADIQLCLKNTTIEDADYTFFCRDGRELTCKMDINLLRDEQENPACCLMCVKTCDESQPFQGWHLSGEIYRRIVETADLGVWITDPHGTTLYVNKKMADMLGYDRKEMIGKAGLNLVEVGRAEPGSWNQELSGSLTMIEREYKLRKENGDVVWSHVNASPLFSESGCYLGNLMMHTDITERKLLEQALAKANADLENKVKDRTLELEDAKEQLEFYTREIIRVQEDERKRISLELHDDTAQNLALLTLEIDRILASEDTLPESILARLKKLREDTDRTQKEVRRFSHELRPGVLDYLGLGAALEGLADDINETGQFKVYLQINGTERRLPDEMELALFRIAQ